MTPKLRAMIAAIGILSLGGVGLYMYTPVPAARTMAELRDAGIASPAGQKFVLTCPERLTQATRNRINRLQPGVLRPRQWYANVSRVAVCFNPDAGNCFRPSDGLLRVGDLQGEVIVPSLRRDMAGASDDAGTDDAGEDTAVDDAWQFELTNCTVTTCQNADAGGLFSNAPCNNLNRLWVVDQPCRIPRCINDAGVWDDSMVVDCRRRDPTFGATDGGMTTAWRGCNAMPAASAVGAACLPTACGPVAGETLESEWSNP